MALLATWEAANPSGASWGLAELRSELETPNSLIWIAEAQGEPTGYLIARQQPDGVELLNMLVAPAARRRGVARFLLTELLAFAGAMPVFLEVRAENEPALALYTMAGFHRVGFRKRYYRDGADALLMASTVQTSK